MNMHTRQSSVGTGRTGHRSFAIAKVVTFLFLATMLQPLMGSPAAAQNTAPTIPVNVLQASVRIMTNIEVTPDDANDDPFLCMVDEETVLDWSVGSGTIITEDGYVLTNHHVVTAERMPREVKNFCEDQATGGKASVDWVMTAWLPDEKGTPTDAYRAEVVEDSSMRVDLAVVQLTRHADGSRVNTERDPFPFTEFGDSDLLREPEKIFLVGYPANAGSNRRVSEGIFSGWGDNGYGEQWIYTDATISGGNSGGTGVNSDGLFIGIPTEATSDDCRPGDTNQDGTIDDNDQGCIGIGGNYGILIPSNIAREFAEEAIGEKIAVASQDTPTDETPTPEDETPEVVDTDGPPFGDVEFSGYDEDGELIDGFTNINKLDGCFDNNWVKDGQQISANWYLNDEVVYEDNFRWDEAWDPTACVSIYIVEGHDDPFLDAGEYRVELTVDDQTVASDPVTVTRGTNVEAVTISGRTAESESVEPTGDNVLTGEITTITVAIDFANMEEDSIWQVDLVQDGDIVVSSESEAWGADPAGSERIRLRNEDREPFAAGDYEVVITIDGVEAGRVPLTIED